MTLHMKRLGPKPVIHGICRYSEDSNHHLLESYSTILTYIMKVYVDMECICFCYLMPYCACISLQTVIFCVYFYTKPRATVYVPE
jgi:hypothetical protein